MRRLLPVLLSLCLLLSCSGRSQRVEDRLVITAVNFPAYDAARAIVGERADLKMLLPCGAESHSYEPNPEDIRRILASDLFLYTGGQSDSWLDYILEDLDGKVETFTLMGAVTRLLEEGDTLTVQSDGELDEHVWTSPANEKAIVSALLERICALDEGSRDFYEANAKAYLERIEALDRQFGRIVQEAKRHTLVIADRYPISYFAEEYGLKVYAAFPGCAAETEPNARTVASLIDLVKRERIPVVLHMELANTLMAQVISEETGARVLEFDSAHNVSKREFDRGITWVEIMARNVDVLKEALE